MIHTILLILITIITALVGIWQSGNMSERILNENQMAKLYKEQIFDSNIAAINSWEIKFIAMKERYYKERINKKTRCEYCNSLLSDKNSCDMCGAPK